MTTLYPAPLLSLEHFRAILALNPWHFWQLADATIVPVTSSCLDTVYQYAWQNVQAAGRADILEAIANAESLLAKYLEFWPAPRWSETTLPFPQYNDHRIWRMGHGDADGRWLDVRLPGEGHVQNLGVESLTALGEQAMTFSDDDGDGLDETWVTAAVATTETDEDNIAVYFAAADRMDSELSNWRVHPVRVTISGGSVTVQGRRWQVARPVLYEGANKNPIDPTVDANFAASLAVYVRKNNPDGSTTATAQAKLIWETQPYPAWAVCCGCGGSISDPSTDPAAVAEGVARSGIRDSRAGIVNVGSAIYDTTDAIWKAVEWGICRPPSRVTVRFRAGYPLENGDVARQYRIAVARLAAAELAKSISACADANRELYRWQFDMARSSGNDDESYAFLPSGMLDNPYGTRRGHIYAWKFIQEQRNLVGFTF